MRSCTCVGYGAGSIQPRASIDGMLGRAEHRLARCVACLFALLLFFGLFPQQARADWSAWENLGGQLLEAPTCVSWGENRIDCLARHPVDTQVRHIAWDGTKWGIWESRGAGAAFPSAPNCLSWGANRIDCFARDYQQPGPMWHTFWDGTQWVGQTQTN